MKHTREILEAFQRLVPETSTTLQAVASRALQEIETAEENIRILSETLEKLGTEVHEETGHMGQFHQCENLPCRETNFVLEKIRKQS